MISKMDKYLARLRKKEDLNKIKNDRGHIYHQHHSNPAAPADHEGLHANESDNQRTSKFLDTQLNPLNHKEKNLNRLLPELRRISNQKPCNK
jgi:regulator of sirC expression with transglutaminase-like and TPR domain